MHIGWPLNRERSECLFQFEKGYLVDMVLWQLFTGKLMISCVNVIKISLSKQLVTHHSLQVETLLTVSELVHLLQLPQHHAAELLITGVRWWLTLYELLFEDVQNRLGRGLRNDLAKSQQEKHLK